jgi:hypothetical protein
MLDDALVLDTWSSGSGCPSPVLPLLALAHPELSPAQRDDLAGDEANRSLLATMRELGEQALDTLAVCPRCDEANEVVLPLDVLQVGAGGPSTGTVAVGSDTVGYRVPSVGDLEAARQCADADAAERLLVDRCMGGELDPETLASIAAELDERHPLLAPRVEVGCASCDATFDAGLDVAELAWASVSTAATRLLDEVAHLARAYGWSEAEVLAVPRARRAVYRRLIDDGLV